MSLTSCIIVLQGLTFVAAGLLFFFGAHPDFKLGAAQLLLAAVTLLVYT